MKLAVAPGYVAKAVAPGFVAKAVAPGSVAKAVPPGFVAKASCRARDGRQHEVCRQIVGDSGPATPSLCSQSVTQDQ